MESDPSKEFPGRLGAWIDGMRRDRRALGLAAVVPVLLALFDAALAQSRAALFVFPCPLLPNASVAWTATLHEACPLGWADQVEGIVRGGRLTPLPTERAVAAAFARGEPLALRVQPLRGAARSLRVAPERVEPATAAVKLAAAAALAGILVATVLFTVAPAATPAAVPFALIHAVAGVGAIALVAGDDGGAFEVADALARGTLAGALVHLGLVFPERRGVSLRFPEAVAAPYLFAYVVSALELQAAYRGSALAAALAQRMLVAEIGLGAALLALGCYGVARESPSQPARAQARVFLAGLVALAVGSAPVWAFGPPSLRLAAATLLAALLPLPVGYALSRWEVPDLGASFRAGIAQALYLTLWSSALFVAVWALRERLALPAALRHPMVIFTGVYASALALDPLRLALKRRVRALVLSERIDWEGLGREWAQRIAAQRTPEGVASAVAAAIRRGLGDTGVAIFVREATGFALLEAVGARAFLDPVQVELLAEWTDAPVVDLNRRAALPPAAQEAHAAGLCALARAACDGQLVAVLALVHAERGRMLGASEQQWVATLADLAAAALVGARLERELRVAERSAARGRLEAELAHDVAKPLGALEAVARQLTLALDPDDALVPPLRKIARLALRVRELTRSALEHGERGRAKLDDLVQVACLEVRALHGDRVAVGELPDLGELPPGFERLVRVLVNLLDNALRASPPDDAVSLRARRVADWLELEVEDRGAGMTSEQLRRAFVPFASFRGGGSGLGLAISRQIVSALGGRLALQPRSPGPGLRAWVRLPLRERAAPEESA